MARYLCRACPRCNGYVGIVPELIMISHLIHNRQKSVHQAVAGAWILAVVFLGCREVSVKHDENLAGRRAKEFAEAGFVRQDFESAYRELSDATKRYVSLAARGESGCDNFF